MRRSCPVLLTTLAWLALAPALPAELSSGLMPLAGERLDYRVRWGALPVATATLAVEPGEEGAVVLRGEARSLGWVDLIYPVRDRVESTVQAARLRPLRFVKRTKEGFGEPDLVEVEFDPVAGVARYLKNGEPLPPLELPAEFHDPLSCLYAYRALAGAGGAEVRLEVTDGKRVLSGIFRELRRERVATPAGEFDAVVVEPEIEGLGGVFRDREERALVIWFTDDTWRRPVKFHSEVAVGGFTIELTRLQDGG